ncbi:MAG TPA: TIGR03000 domain-containing protein [Gemmataceae bacterium]
MYSMVLMMAMTGSPDVAAFGFRKGDCNGGCVGYACNGGCVGYACCGCDGGKRRGGLFGGNGLFGKKRNGCNGGCHGGCYGYHGGCHGGCYGYHGGCHGGCYGHHGGCHGCHGGVAVPPPPPPGQILPGPAKEMPKGSDSASAPAPATISVTLPADATLTIDGAPTQSTSGVRTFTTPALEPGQVYHYTLRAEVEREGKTLTASERVEVRAGATTRVELMPATASVSID